MADYAVGELGPASDQPNGSARCPMTCGACGVAWVYVYGIHWIAQPGAFQVETWQRPTAKGA